MNASLRCVTVESPARLHLGFVDLSGDLGRKFGSLGLAIEGLSTVVRAVPAEGLQVSGLESDRTEKYARETLRTLGLPSGVALDVIEAIPAHAGLGSGTQLALAVASAIVNVNGLHQTTRELAAVTGRGLRSGIGIGVFDTGGFILDGGLAERTVVPPVLSRFEFPETWRVILVHDDAHKGLNGPAEQAAFKAASPMQPNLADKLCRLTLMGVFPALVEQDFATFSSAVAEIQNIIGGYFGPWQGGAFTSADVRSAIGVLHNEYGLAGVGQTSWGPTGFAFVESAPEAAVACAALCDRFAERSCLRFSVHSARNSGASIHCSETLPRESNATA